MTREERFDGYLHFIMSAMGGFLGAYAVMSEAERLASAQTANLLDMMIHLAGGDILRLAAGFGTLVCFVGGLVSSDLIERHTKLCLKKLALWVDAAGLLLTMGLLAAPLDITPIIKVYPIFFMAAFQWNGYGGAWGFASSSLFSTNNLKQCVIGFTEYFITGDAAMLKRGKFYLYTLLSFLAGAFYGACCVNRWGVAAAIPGLLIPACARVVLGRR